MTTLAMHRPNRELKLEKAFRRAVLYSLGIHFAVLLVIAVAGRFHFRSRLDERAIRVSFLPGQPGAKPRKGSFVKPPSPPPSRPKPAANEIKPAEKPKDPEPKPETKEIAAVKETKEKTGEKKPNSSAETKPPESHPSDSNTSEPSSNPNLTPGTPDGSTAWDAAMAGIAGDSVLLAYYTQVSASLAEAWRVPPTVPLGQDLYVEVFLQVDKNGNVLGYQITHNSGNEGLDLSVARLLKNLKQVPALSRPIEGGYLDLPLRFQPAED